jgi:hypothetical protein
VDDLRQIHVPLSRLMPSTIDASAPNTLSKWTWRPRSSLASLDWHLSQGSALGHPSMLAAWQALERFQVVGATGGQSHALHSHQIVKYSMPMLLMSHHQAQQPTPFSSANRRCFCTQHAVWMASPPSLSTSSLALRARPQLRLCHT